MYLNNLAQSVFNSLYKLKRDPFGNFVKFWKISLPVEMYRARKHLYASFLVFTIAILIGIVSTWDDMNFTRIILGDDYVNMTDSFIEEGDPMAVYKQDDEFPMFVRLFLNNIRVAFLTFALGLMFCAGTGFILLTNGIMIGTFHTYFYLKEIALGKGLLLTSLLTVWIHGTFEILAIVLSGAAGFVAGMSLLHPGNYTRAQSFQIGIRRGLKIMLGVTPFIFFAAILEGYVTRHTEMPDFIKMLIIFGSLAIFVFYFMIYPFMVVRKYKDQIEAPSEPVYRPSRKVELYKLKQVNEIVADAFILFREIYRKSSSMLWGVLIPLHLILAYFMLVNNSFYMSYHNLNAIELLDNMLVGNGNPFYFILVSFLFSFSLALPLQTLRNYEDNMAVPYLKRFGKLLGNTLVSFPFMTAFLSLIFVQRDFVILIFLAIPPLIIYVSAGINLNKQKGFEKISQPVSAFFSQIGNSYGLYGLVFLILGGIFLLLNSAVYGIVESMIEWHAITRIQNYELFINFIHTSVYIIFLHHFFIFVSLAFGLFHYVNIETKESVSLYRKLGSFGKTSKTHEGNNNDE